MCGGVYDCVTGDDAVDCVVFVTVLQVMCSGLWGGVCDCVTGDDVVVFVAVLQAMMQWIV